MRVVILSTFSFIDVACIIVRVWSRKVQHCPLQFSDYAAIAGLVEIISSHTLFKIC